MSNAKYAFLSYHIQLIKPLGILNNYHSYLFFSLCNITIKYHQLGHIIARGGYGRIFHILWDRGDWSFICYNKNCRQLFECLHFIIWNDASRVPIMFNLAMFLMHFCTPVRSAPLLPEKCSVRFCTKKERTLLAHLMIYVANENLTYVRCCFQRWLSGYNYKIVLYDTQTVTWW